MAVDGEQALAAGRDPTLDLILLDVMLPAMSGLEVLRRLRSEAITHAGDRRLGQGRRDRPGGGSQGRRRRLRQQAVQPAELLARIEAVLRRQRRAASQGGDEVGPTIRSGDLAVDVGTPRGDVQRREPDADHQGVRPARPPGRPSGTHLHSRPAAGPAVGHRLRRRRADGGRPRLAGSAPSCARATATTTSGRCAASATPSRPARHTRLMPVVADELLGDAIEALLGRSGETILRPGR